MKEITKNNLVYGVVGGVIGGIVSYLIIEAILYKIQEEHGPYNDGIDMSVAWEGPETLDYSALTRKPDISELVKPYNKPKGPTIVSEHAVLGNQWVDDEKRDYDMHYINYYVKDQIFVDSSDTIIDDPNTKFGPNIHLHFGEQAGDPDLVYVLVEEDGIIYEIIQIHDSYNNFISKPPEKEKVPEIEELKPERSSSRRGRRTAKKTPPKPTKQELMDEVVEEDVVPPIEDPDEDDDEG